MEVFLSVGMATSIRVQILSLLSLTMMSSRLAGIVLSVWMSMSYRMVILSFSATVVGGVVIPFVSSIYIVLSADLPIEVSCDLVVPLDIFCLSKLRAIRHEVFQSFFIAIKCTESAMTVSTIFYEVVVVRSSGRALILCRYDESLRFRFKPGAFGPWWAISVSPEWLFCSSAQVTEGLSYRPFWEIKSVNVMFWMVHFCYLQLFSGLGV